MKISSALIIFALVCSVIFQSCSRGKAANHAPELSMETNQYQDYAGYKKGCGSDLGMFISKKADSTEIEILKTVEAALAKDGFQSIKGGCSFYLKVKNTNCLDTRGKAMKSVTIYRMPAGPGLTIDALNENFGPFDRVAKQAVTFINAYSAPDYIKCE